MEEATAFLETVAGIAPKVALGVSLCISSAVVLLILVGISARGMISEEAAEGVGVVVLLCFVATGVFLFITSSRKMEPYKYLEEMEIDTAYGVDGMVREKRAGFERKYTLLLATGIMCCILCAIPLITAGSIVNAASEELVLPLMVAAVLVIVAVGVNMIIRASYVMGAYNKLLQENGYTLNEKKLAKTTGKIGGIYWPVVVAIYLAWSFPTNDWQITWIIWPVAGVLFGAVQGIVRLLMKDPVKI